MVKNYMGIDGIKINVIKNQFIPLAADDFSIFQKAYSGIYFILGCGYSQLHTSEFNVNEVCISNGIRAMAKFLINFLNKI